MNDKVKKIVQIFFAILFWVGLWALISYKVSNQFLLPDPKAVFVTTLDLIASADFWLITLQSLTRILCGIIIAFIIGIALAILTTSFSFSNMLVTPFMSTVKATPVASFIFVAIILMDRNFLPVFITALLVLPIVWTNVSSGIRSVSPELSQVAKVYSLSIGKRITRLYIPCIMPYFLAACRSALGMAWKAGVAAEVLCTPKFAIGTELYYSKTYLETQMLFAWTLITIILSLVIEKVIIYFISKLVGKLPKELSEVNV